MHGMHGRMQVISEYRPPRAMCKLLTRPVPGQELARTHALMHARSLTRTHARARAHTRKEWCVLFRIHAYMRPACTSQKRTQSGQKLVEGALCVIQMYARQSTRDTMLRAQHTTNESPTHYPREPNTLTNPDFEHVKQGRIFGSLRGIPRCLASSRRGSSCGERGGRERGNQEEGRADGRTDGQTDRGWKGRGGGVKNAPWCYPHELTNARRLLFWQDGWPHCQCRPRALNLPFRPSLPSRQTSIRSVALCSEVGRAVGRRGGRKTCAHIYGPNGRTPRTQWVSDHIYGFTELSRAARANSDATRD